MNYMNVLSDFEIRLNAICPVDIHNAEVNRLSESIGNKDLLIRELQEKLAKLEKKAGATRRKSTASKKTTGTVAAARKTASAKQSSKKVAVKKTASTKSAVRKKTGTR